MDKFTLSENISVPQSVGPSTGGSNDPQGSTKLYVFEPLQGRDLIYYNPRKIDSPVILSSFSLSMKGTMGDPDEAGAGVGVFAKYNVFVNDVLIDSGETTADFDSYDFTDVPFGKEPTLPDIVEIKVEYPEDLTGYRYQHCEGGIGNNQTDCEDDEGIWVDTYDRNLYVESITIGTLTIMTQHQHNSQPTDVNVFYDKAQNSGGSGVNSWSGMVADNGGMGWSGFMIFQIPKGYFELDLGGEPDNLPVLSTKIFASYDNRIPLGTYTLNNRGTWEENNYNESTLQPYLNEETPTGDPSALNESYRLQTRETITVETIDGDITIPPSNSSTMGIYNELNVNKFSVEALPFVINPNTDDIIHLDRYYDKEIDKENYELATEGKINLKLQAREYGRVPSVGESRSINFGENIDIFSNRPALNAGTWFDTIITVAPVGPRNGIYLFKLNWGDDSELEYTDKPKLLENTVLFEHHYDKPGFYTISGVMYRMRLGYLVTWEKFETNILLNPSPNYELNLFDYNNFASIGGISKDSAFVKSLYNLIGIDPLTYEVRVNSDEHIKAYNELDNIKILDTLAKIDNDLIKPIFGGFLSPYQTPTDGVVSFTFGCMDSASGNLNQDDDGAYITDINGDLPDDNGYMALNYNPDATFDDGTCIYTYNVTLDVYPTSVLLYGFDDAFIMPGPKIDEVLITNPSIITPYQDIGISLNYSSSTVPFETTGNPTEVDWQFRGWFDGSLVNQSNNDYSIAGIEPIYPYETVGAINVIENIHLIAIYEYDDTTLPPPVDLVETLNTDDDFDFPFESINVRYLPPQTLPVPMDIVSFEIVRFYSTWSNGVVTGNIDLIHTQDFQINHANEAYNHLDVGLDPLIEYTYSVFTVDDVGNRSTEVSSTETPIADIPPATPVVEGLINQEADDGYKYVEFTWTVLDPNDSASDIQGLVADGTSNSFPLVGDFSHYVVRRTQIGGTEEGVVYYPMNTYNNLNDYGEGYGSGTRPDEYIGNYLFRDNTVEYDGPSYIYQVASVDINNHESPYSLEMEILPSLSADIGMINSASWMDGDPSVRPPGISLNWPRVYYREISADSLELDESSVTFSAEFNPDPGDHQAGGNYIGFEIQKKANGEWSRNGVSILADTWQTIGPFYKTTNIYQQHDELGAAGTVGAEWEVPHLEQYDLYGFHSLLFLFPELGPYEDKYPNLQVNPDRASNTMSSFSSEFDGHPNWSVQYADIPEESDEITNTFYDDGWESKWGTLVPGLEYQYRIRNITTDKDSFSPPNLPIYFGNWAESEPVMVGESTFVEFGAPDITAPIITTGADSTLQSAIPSLTNEYAVDLTIRVGPPNGAFESYDYDYFKIAVLLPAGSLGGNDVVYHNGDDYTTEESYIYLDPPPNEELVEGQILTYQITNLTETTLPHVFILQIVDTSGNESEQSIEGSHTDSNNYIYPRSIPEFPSGTPPANPSWETGTIWIDDDGNTWQYVWFTWNQVGETGNNLTSPQQLGWLFISLGDAPDPPPGPILGCMDPDASNYDPDAEEDNGSCQYIFTVQVNLNGPQGYHQFINYTGIQLGANFSYAAEYLVDYNPGQGAQTITLAFRNFVLPVELTEGEDYEINNNTITLLSVESDLNIGVAYDISDTAP